MSESAKKPSAVFFRCDAGAGPGLGHLLRCLTLADAFAGRKLPVRFVTGEGDDLNGAQIIARRGLTPVVMGGPVASPQDRAAFLSLLEDAALPLAVIDSWNADGEYMEAVGRRATTLRIDDFSGQPPGGDILLNAHLGASYQNGKGTQLRLLGPRYNLVREQFFEKADSKVAEPRIVVTFGGEDPLNQSLWALVELADVLSGYMVDLILGPAHPDPSSVEQAAAAMPNIRLHVDPDDMAPLLAGAALAITAGGTTCYELAAAGVAQVGIITEEHQRPLVESLVAADAMVLLGDYRALDADRARTEIERLLQDGAARERLATAGRKLLPGPGAPHVVDAVLDHFGRCC